RVLKLVMLLGVVGCNTETAGDDDGGATNPPDSGTCASCEALCFDLAEVVGQAGERCGFGYQPTYDGFVGAVNECKIRGVRDERALVDLCLPSLQTVSCEDFEAGI